MGTTATDALRVELELAQPQPDTQAYPQVRDIRAALRLGRPTGPIDIADLSATVDLSRPVVLFSLPSLADTDRLPLTVERGAIGGPEFVTQVATSRSGQEQRNALVLARQRWDIGYGISTADDYEAVRDFFYARRGRLRSFRFRDWSDYQADAEEFAIADGTTTVFQLQKTYSSGGYDYVRKITRPVSPITITPTPASIDYQTGRITYSAPPAATTSLSWTGTFDVPVRFDNDAFGARVTHTDAISVENLSILEVIE